MPQSSSGMETRISFAVANAISLSRLSVGGTFETKSEKTSFSFQSLLANRSLIVSVIMSETRQKSAGHEAPPKGSWRQIMM